MEQPNSGKLNSEHIERTASEVRPSMSRLHLWAMRWLMRAALYNSVRARPNVAQLLEVILQELRTTYYEDNLATIVYHFEECSNDALRSVRMNSMERASKFGERVGEAEQEEAR